MGKTLQEQTIKDNFMFAAIMMDGSNCKHVLERILEIEIDYLEVDYEKSIVYHPEYHGIRLDVYARDDNHTHFNVEMQTQKLSVVKRARYYHSQIDMDLLKTGIDYDRLPSSYVIFICDYDPFGLWKYKYTLHTSFLENMSYNYDDGIHTYFLNTKGTNDEDVPKELIKFLAYIHSGEDDGSDPLVSDLKQSEIKIKASREMGVYYMLFEEMMNDKYKNGFAEGKLEEQSRMILSFLSNGGSEEDAIRMLGVSQDDIDRAKNLLPA